MSDPEPDAGRIYVVVFQQFNNYGEPIAGISLDAPGAFTIDGLDANQSYDVYAWRDALGATRFNAAFDPAASGSVTLGTTSYTGVQLNLSYPSAATLSSAPNINLASGMQGLIGVLWDDVRNSQGDTLADHYVVQCSTDSTFTTVDIEQTLIASEDNIAFLPANAGTYACRMAGVNHGAQGPFSSATASFVVPSSGSGSITGFVSNANLLPHVPLDVLAYGGNSLGGVQLLTRSEPASYSIAGLIDGNAYVTIGFLDANGNGQPDPSEPATVVSGFVVAQASAQGTSVPLGFSTADSVGSAPTDHHLYADGGEMFAVSLRVTANAKQPVNARLETAADLPAPADFPITSGGFGPIQLSRSYALAAAPASNASWPLTVGYSDGTQATVAAAVPDLLLSAPTPLAVQPSATPTFSWLAPAVQPSRPWSYGLEVQCQNLGTVWKTDFLPPALTSVTYGQFGNANPALLPAGAKCTWTIGVRDSAEDSVEQDATFSVPITVDVTPTSTTLNPGQSQQFVAVVNGGSGGVSWSVQEFDGGIDATGIFTAPASSTDGDVFHVTARAVADTTASATATVTISTTPQLEVSVSPTSATLGMGQVQAFTATVANIPDGGSGAVSWTLLESDAGSIDTSGRYVAPAHAGTFHVIAQSQDDPARLASAAVTVDLSLFALVTVTPSERYIATGESVQFAAQVIGASDVGVRWSASDGAIDDGGNFTAPATDGTAVIAATSSADPLAVGYALVHYASAVGVQVSPSQVALLAGETQQFQALFVGPATHGVTWSVSPNGCGTIDANGSYTAPSTATTCAVIATSNDDASQFASASVLVSPSEPTLSGTVSYSGSALGRVVITAYSSWGQAIGSTSLVGAGAYTLHGLNGFGGPYVLHAWLDETGAIREVPLLDPAGSLWVDGGYGGSSLDFTLSDPAAVSGAPPSPSIQWVEQGGPGAIVHFNRVHDANGSELADHYTVYLLDPNDGTVLLSRTIGAWAEDAFYLAPLADWASFDAVVTATAQGHESAPSASMKVFTGTWQQNGSNTVQVSVDLGPAPQPGVLWLRLNGSSAGMTTAIVRPAPHATYSFQSLPDGDYGVTASYDTGDDGQLGPGDPSSGGNNSAFTVSVAGGQTASAPDISLAASASASVTTNVFAQSGYSGASLNFGVTSGARVPVRATLIGGTDAGLPQDLAINAQNWNGQLQWNGYTFFNSGAPTVGQSYALGVSYSDGTSEVLSGSVTAVLDPPTAISPVDAGSTVPTFVWAPGATTPASGSYTLNVGQANGAFMWFAQLPLGTTSAVYDFDGRANQPSLTPGVQYQWMISVQDLDGNSAQRSVLFTAQ